MLENMFDQETVTRNENLRHYREGEERGIKKGEQKSTERIVRAMLLAGEPDSKIMEFTEISKQELSNLKARLEAEKQEKL